MSIDLAKSNGDEFVVRRLGEAVNQWLARKEGVLVFGARQVGKSTFLKHLAARYPMGKYLSFDEKETLRRAKESPQGFLEEVVRSSDPVFIDEFQKVPEISVAIKYLFDSRTPKPKFFLSGSISDMLVSGGDSLAGRVMRFPLYTFSFREFLSAKRPGSLEEGVSLEDLLSGRGWPREFLEKVPSFELMVASYAQSGGYPATVDMGRGELDVFFRSVVSAFLEKDLLGKLRLGRISQLEKLAVILAKRVSLPLSFNSLAGELGVDIKTVQRLVDILRFSWWIDVVYPEARFGSEFKSKFKVYFLDTGLRNFLAGAGDAWEFDPGPLFENLVFGVLKRYLSYAGSGLPIRFWRTYDGGEVDFLLGEGEKTVAVEVKASRLSSARVPSGLKSFIKKYHPKEALVVNRNFWGKENFEKTEISFVPLYAFALLI